MVVYAFNAHIWEAEAGWFMWVQGQPGPYRECQGSQEYIEAVSKEIEIEIDR